MSRSFSIGMIILLLIGALVFRIPIATASPATITVPDEYPTIQAAVNAAVDGDTVFVRNGTYYEHLTVNKRITLVGENTNATIIDGNGTGTVVQITADHVSILNFTIRNAGGAIYPNPQDFCLFGSYIQGLDIENDNIINGGVGIGIGDSYAVNISDNFVLNTVGTGIDVGDTQNPGLNRNITVSNNFVQGSSDFGINVDGDTEYCNFINNTVENCGTGINLGPNVNSLLVPSNNLVDGNVLVNNTVVNLLVIGSKTITQPDYTNTFRGNSLTNSQHNNLIIWGFNLPTFMQDIDASNAVNGKKIYYLVNDSNLEMNSSDYPDTGYIALVNCSNVTLKNFDFAGNKDGLLLAGANSCSLENLTLGNNRLNLTEGNLTMLSNWGGLTFFESNNNTVDGCTVCNNTYGVCMYYSDQNLFFHNSFVNNYKSVVSDFYYPFQNYSSGYLSTNFWDDTYPSGGNYWSDYNGTDLYSGPYQNVTGSDGIGDTPYMIDANNTDHYPLMGGFSDFNVAQGIDVQIVSNSSISNFQFNGTAILFTVSNMNGTIGFCNVRIPSSLLNSSLTVLVNGTLIQYDLVPSLNNTQQYLYFICGNSTEQVTVLPEFSDFLIMMIFILVMLSAIAIYEKKVWRSK